MSSNLDVRAANSSRSGASIPALNAEGPWEKILLGRGRAALELMLPGILRSHRWFGGKGRRIRSAEIVEKAGMEYKGVSYYICMVRVQYEDGAPEMYVLPLSFVPGDSRGELAERDAAGVMFRLKTESGVGAVCDAARDRQFACALLEWIGGQQKVAIESGDIEGIRTSSFEQLKGEPGNALEPHIMRAEQSNTSVRFGERLILKLFRRVERGVNPEFEVGRFLTERGFRSCAPVAGALEMRDGGSEASTLAILQGFVPNRGDAWKYTLESLRASCDKAVMRREELDNVETPTKPLLKLADENVPEFVDEVAGEYLQSAALLGRRTAEMHLTLACGENQNFSPEDFTPDYRRFLYESMRELTAGVMDLLRSHLALLRDGDRTNAEGLLDREDELLEQFRAVLDMELDATRIRVHGDYHLGQVLFTDDDFIIIDFEGEPLRPIRERRIKRSPLRDVAGMLRSFQYAGFSVLMERQVPNRAKWAESGGLPGWSTALQRFTAAWSAWASAAFMREYLGTCRGASFIPKDRSALAMLLNALQLEKAVYELGYEINNRPDWARVPMSGISRLLDERAEEARGLRRVA